MIFFKAKKAKGISIIKIAVITIIIVAVLVVLFFLFFGSWTDQPCGPVSCGYVHRQYCEKINVPAGKTGVIVGGGFVV